MRLLLLITLGCSGVPTFEVFGDAGADALILAESAPIPAFASTASAPNAPPRPIPRLTRSVAAEELAARLQRGDTDWMWSAALLPDFAAFDVTDAPPGLSLPPQYGLARTSRLARVTLFQSVGIDIAEDGAELVPASPVIAGRGLRVRAYLEGGVGSLVLGRLRWESGGTTTLYVGSMRVQAPSDDADPGSLFEFVVPKERVTEDARFVVDILEDAGDSFAEPSRARYPMDGQTHALGAEESMRIDVRVVPMRYAFDSSMRLPDVSDAEIAALREHIEAVFPVVEASVSVLPPQDYGAEIRRDNFDDHVDALHQVIAWRANDAPPSATYYVALVAPAPTFGEYCTGSCYAGVAPLNETNTPFQRASVVVWYGAARSGWTALHELGHTQGRAHVACGGVSGEDPEYPYLGGVVGVWGFDQRAGAFIAPSAHDFMSYCGDEWVSDYTYAAMARRVRALRGAPSMFAQIPTGSRRLITTGERVRWSNVTLPPGVVGEATELVAIDSRGRRRMVPAERIRYSIDGPSSYALSVDSDVRAYIVEGSRLDVSSAMRGF